MENKIIELKSGGYTAWILPERGGSCIRLSRFGAEALRTPSGADDYKAGRFLWGTPILFFPNRISGGCFEFEGREYRFPINEGATGCFLHGTLHETPFETETQSREEAVLRYRATEENPYLTFPHAFTLTVQCRLSAAGLYQRAEFVNDSGQNMPVALAFHTTFRLPFTKSGKAEKVRLRLDTELEYGRNEKTFLPDGRVWQIYPDKQEMADGRYFPSEHTVSRLFRMGKRQEMQLTDPAAGVTVRYTAGSTYRYWMVYNGGHNDFLCVEPQSWLSNCPNAPFDRNQQGFDYLAPGEIRVYETNMSIGPIE